MIKDISSDITEIEADLSNIKSSYERLKEDVNNLKDTAKLQLSSYFNFKNASKYLLSEGLSPDDRGDKTKISQSVFRKIDEIVAILANQLNTLNQKVKLLQADMQASQTDLNLCLNTIDEALAPEYKELMTKIGLGYTVLITLGLIILLIIIGIMINKISHDTIRMLISDGGLQFVTIFILMIAVILFGILNILEGKELAAILAGVSGYILGRGSRSIAEKREEKEAKSLKEEKKDVKTAPK
jgi:outer membrane murein-binding lipoprotein Lpp